MWPFKKNTDLDQIPYKPDIPRNIVFDPENKKKYNAGAHAPAITQDISIVLENENAKVIEESPVNFTYVIGQVWEIKNKVDLPFLLGIDLNGNTIFNVYQAPRVIEELKKLATCIHDEGLLSDIAETIRLLKKVEQHYYIRFIGD